MEEDTIRRVCFIISDLILRKKRSYDNNVTTDTIISEILRDIDELHLQYENGNNSFKSALTDLKGATISLLSSIETTDQFFRNALQKAHEAMSSNSIECQILATRLRIIAVLYLHRYFTLQNFDNTGSEQFYQILNDFLHIPIVKQSLLLEFDNHPIENIWRKFVEPSQSELADELTQEMNLLQQVLLTYTSQEYNISTKDGNVQLCHFDLMMGHNLQINSLVMYDDILISGSSDMTIKLWDIHKLHEIITFSGHSAPITSLCLQDDRIYSCDELGYLKIWDTEILTEISSNRTRKFSISCFTVFGDKIYCGFEDGRIMILDVDSLSEINSFQAHSTCVKQIVVYQEKIYSSGKIVKIWKNPTCELQYKLRGHDHGVTSMILHEKRLYTGARSIRVWNIETLEFIGECKKHTHDVKVLHVYGDRLYSAGHVIRVWDINTLRLVQVLRGYSSPINTLVIYNDIMYTGCELRKEIQSRHIG